MPELALPTAVLPLVLALVPDLAAVGFAAEIAAFVAGITAVVAHAVVAAIAGYDC